MTNSRAGGPPRWLSRVTRAFGVFLVVLVVLANSGLVSSELLRITRAVPGGDKTIHFWLAGTMALLLNWTWRGAHWRLGPLPVYKGSVLIALVATLEEFSQKAMRVRAFDLEDLAYDYAGILLLGQIGAFLALRFRGRSGPEAAAGLADDARP